MITAIATIHCSEDGCNETIKVSMYFSPGDHLDEWSYDLEAPLKAKWYVGCNPKYFGISATDYHFCPKHSSNGFTFKETEASSSYGKTFHGSSETNSSVIDNKIVSQSCTCNGFGYSSLGNGYKSFCSDHSSIYDK